jgi:hypothetical protein
VRELLKGRETDPGNLPRQDLVAFSHDGNSSGRRIPVPDDMKPGCFLGFPEGVPAFWVHKLAGVEVEEEKEVTNTVLTKSK